MKSLTKKYIFKLGNYFLGYRLKYIIAHAQVRWNSSNIHKKQYDLVFVSPEKGWILDGICQEIDRYYSGKTEFRYSISNLPAAKAYFFSHYSLFASAILANPHILNSINLIYYTHPRVFAMNSACAEMLQSLGLKSSKVQALVGAANRNLFMPAVSKTGERPCIGFCLGFKGHQHYRERKNYDLIVELIKIIDGADVMIVGKDWSQYERFYELQELPYFRYVEVPYEQYPTYYQQMDVFVSASKLEGGPIPLIEAMMCNVFPVVSYTGFAPDIITHGENGFLFDVDASPKAIYDLIQQALTLQIDVRKTVEHLTWENFSREIQKAIVSV
jgi:glycosyltransferase involved in cell wall biosynthesis